MQTHIIALIELLKNLNEKSAALTLINALAKHAASRDQYDLIAQAYFKLKHYHEAIKFAELTEMASSGPEERYIARSNLINLYNHANFPDKAMELIERNESAIPNDIDIQLEKAFSLYLLNRKDEAEQILLKHLNDPSISDEVRNKIKFNLGTYKMHRDEFLEGLSLFLFKGRELGYWKCPVLPFTLWDGSIQSGKSVLIVAEAGIGDEVINVRFMNHIKSRGMEPIWYSTRKDLSEVFNRNKFTVINDINDVRNIPNLLWCHSMDLPILLNLEYKDLWQGPYLKAEPNRIPLDSLYDDSTFKIGLRWQGNPEYDHDLHRFVPLKHIYDAIPSKNLCDLYSFQRDSGVEELKQYTDITNLDKLGFLNHWEDTMSALLEMDIIITTCTSIAHISAAMGKTTCIFVPISSYYTWCHTLKQSPWYGSNVFILRQQKPRTWDEPIGELKLLLSNLVV